MNSEIKNIIFDFGGVLIGVDYTKTIDAFKSMGIYNFDDLYSQAQQTNLFDAFETGNISSQYFINKLLDFLPQGVTPNQVVAAWNAMLLDINQKNIALLQELKAEGKNLYMLSNTNEIHIKVAFDRWRKTTMPAPNELFNKMYLSHEIGMRKPDEETFRYVCSDAGLNPGETLFIDDSEQHINGAQEIGLNAFLLKRIDDLYTVFS